MSKLLITKYHNQLHEILSAGGARNEGAITFAFANLLRSYAEKKNLLLVEQKSMTGRTGKTIRPDGTIKYFGGIDLGYWEAKDSGDKLDYEIDKKLNTDGYPGKNIIFEDTQTAVLFQENVQVMRVSMNEWNALDDLLDKFINYEPSEVKEFNKALAHFKEDVPSIVEGLRHLMDDAASKNKTYREKRDDFLEIAKGEINPEITAEDVREMIIQHILTEDIFTNVFGDADFHKFNNIAKELENVIETFMNREVRKNYLSSIENYYKTIRDAASGITDNHEKQKFLKTVYENFYKVYNPKGADKLGVVYTPNEIVRFMIDGTDWLLDKHFNKTLSDKGVDILDPATGTGTFIAELIDKINIHDLEYKYENELHANEVAILPYYIANLNIEYTYQQRKGSYKEFKNICFVDTLDNTNALDYSGKQDMLFGISSENAKRIKDQNAKKISVIIGNPPYNAKQPNYNFQNANRAYKYIDERIKDTYIREGTAQNQIVIYDMFVRFFRWATERLERKNGIIAFVSNSSFIDSQSFDGFRKVVGEEFNEAWIINLKGNARTSGERRRQEAGNIFDDQIRVGVAVYFFIKNEKLSGFKVYYNEIGDYIKSQEKKDYLRDNHISKIKFDRIEPDAKNNWINQTDNDWENLLPLIDKNVKAGKSEEAIISYFSRGLESNRQDWIYDFSENHLSKKMKYLVDIYERSRKAKSINTEIKWSRELERRLKNNKKISFSADKIKSTELKPFVKTSAYIDEDLNSYVYGWVEYKNEPVIAFTSPSGNQPFHTLATNRVPDLHFTGDSQCLPFYIYEENQKHENITDWALNQFQTHYKESNGAKITKQDVFYYVYAVLHSPVYRKKYEQNLKREFPRLPFYADFFQWAKWGAELMDLHINYETQKPFALERKDLDLSAKQQIKQENLFGGKENADDEPFIPAPKTKLRADKETGTITIDSHTTLTGIPKLAWEYKLGNRSAIEWILDQYKEKTPQDATIRERFNTYKFADYKESVIDLLKRVTTVSVGTMKIVNQMPKE